jgi:hypothetical protein
MLSRLGIIRCIFKGGAMEDMAESFGSAGPKV